MKPFFPNYEGTVSRSKAYFLTWEGIAVLGMITAVGMTAYGMATAPGAPQTQTPPPPPNSVQYGDDGEIMSRQEAVFNKDGDPSSGIKEWRTYGANSEPTRPGENATQAEMDKYNVDHAKWTTDKAARDVEKAKLAGLKTKMLDNLNTTPEDRVKAYAEYQKAYADSAHSVTDPAFAKMARTDEENANATGMFGSRAYVDTKSELEKNKLAQDTAIADQAVMAKEQLASNDRSFYANMLQQIDAGARADTLVQNEISNGMSQSASQKYAGVLGQYDAINSGIIAKNQAEQKLSAGYTSAGMNLAGGLLYLYGGKGSGMGGGGGMSNLNGNQGFGGITSN